MDFDIITTPNLQDFPACLPRCIADLLSMIGYLALTPAREIPAIRQFYFDNQEYYIAAATYNIIYYSLYVRCTGIVFLSLQRYFIITSPLSTFSLTIQNADNWKIILVYWATPTILSIVVLKDYDFHFNNVVDMTLIVDKSVTQRNTVMSLIVVSITCIVSSIAYGALFVFLRKNSSRLSQSLRREVHLAFQVLVLFLAFFAVFVFFASLNYLTQMQMVDWVYYIRGIYPMISGFLSYLNPYCILILNRDLFRQVIKSVRCQGYKGSEAQVSGIVSNTAKPTAGSTNLRGSGTTLAPKKVTFC
ncbi:hypothetical protein B9Z55_013522 [Caenorhabditis nigoni]|uniref:G-protein coupled receptors family 1 profile domain-containing protein n=2 Tax=Caenorhabditis nigoni TaxID=1611254 RepID=A0A2G5U2B5_9PELO|nr:hypothetical protein B9Z55_013522 [Caenorhabditis nigoni]